MKPCRGWLLFVRFNSRPRLVWAPWLAHLFVHYSGWSGNKGQQGFVPPVVEWSRRVVDSGTSEGISDEAQGMRLHERRWTRVSFLDLAWRVTATRLTSRLRRYRVSCRTKKHKWLTYERRHVLGSLTCCKDDGRCRWRPKPRKCSPSPPPKVSLRPHVCPRAF